MGQTDKHIEDVDRKLNDILTMLTERDRPMDEAAAMGPHTRKSGKLF